MAKNKLYAAQMHEINLATTAYLKEIFDTRWSEITDEQLNRLDGWLDFISNQCRTIIEINEYKKKVHHECAKR